MDYELFKDDDERRNAIQRLEELEKSEGWLILVKALEVNIQIFDDELHDTQFEDLRPVDNLQIQIRDLRKLKELPTLLVKDAKDKMTQEEPEDDTEVYDSPPERKSLN